jgi:hypothetical protein
VKKTVSILVFGIICLTSTAFADSQTVMISVNKSVPLVEAEAMAEKLEYRDPNMSMCYVQSHVEQYIPYPSCNNDATCPYWGVALVKLDWNCDLPLKSWIERIQSNNNYTIYSNGPIGPFPIVSGGN